jgi:hypothetical protein
MYIDMSFINLKSFSSSYSQTRLQQIHQVPEFFPLQAGFISYQYLEVWQTSLLHFLHIASFVTDFVKHKLMSLSGTLK